MKIESQICTTKEQSERLLALGLKKETADCIWCEVRTLSRDNTIQWYLLPEYIDKYDEKHIPAWSLHRLIKMYTERYLACSVNLKIFTYEWLINEIEIHIKEGDFNKDYLEEKK